MWPIFTVKVLQDPDWWMVWTQLFSAFCILIAAIVAALYPWLKDRRKYKNKANYFIRKLQAMYAISKFYSEQLNKIPKEYADDKMNQISLLKGFIIKSNFIDDLIYFIENEELLNSYFKKTDINISVITFDINFFIFMVRDETVYEGDKLTKHYDKFSKQLANVQKHMKEIVEGLKKSVNAKNL